MQYRYKKRLRYDRTGPKLVHASLQELLIKAWLVQLKLGLFSIFNFKLTEDSVEKDERTIILFSLSA